MVRAEDVKGGYGQQKKKPSTSILPYLRAKQAEEAEAKRSSSPKPVEKKTEKKAEEKAPHKEETYEEAIHSILSEG